MSNKYSPSLKSVSLSDTNIYTKEECDDCKCKEVEYDNDRIPSNCDRVLYKTSSDVGITQIKYDVIKDYNFVRLSDHLMVFAEFTYNDGLKKGIIFTWNIASLHFDEKDSLEEMQQFISDYRLTTDGYDIICFCFQEVGSTNKFKDVLIQNIGSSGYHVQQNFMRFSLPKYGISILCFTKPPYTSCSKKCYPSGSFKKLKRTKGYAGIMVDGILFLSAHFSIDTSSPDLGLERRKSNLIKIQDDLTQYPNIILAGDLNFRNIGGDQLTRLLDTKFTEFKELGKLQTPTCKVETCPKKYKKGKTLSARSARIARSTRSAKTPSTKAKDISLH